MVWRTIDYGNTIVQPRGEDGGTVCGRILTMVSVTDAINGGYNKARGKKCSGEGGSVLCNRAG